MNIICYYSAVKVFYSHATVTCKAAALNIKLQILLIFDIYIHGVLAIFSNEVSQ